MERPPDLAKALDSKPLNGLGPLLMNPKILIVEDNEVERLRVSETLAPFECEVLEAADGVQGLALARRERPNLLLLDLGLPGMSGSELLTRLRADRGLKHIPVMVITGQASREVVLRVARLGVQDYLVKPFTGESLLGRVMSQIDLQARGVRTVPKRFDEPITLLVVEDKPAILEQVKQGLAGTNWQVEGRSQATEAIEFFGATPTDVVIVSLSLPDPGALAVLRSVRSARGGRKIPVFGLCVKTATEMQRRAMEAGFNGILNKPVQPAQLQSLVSRALRLDTSPKYFDEQNGVLTLRIPAQASAEIATEILDHLAPKLAAAAETGLDKVLLDLSQLNQPGPGLMTLVVNAIRACEDLTMDYRLVGSEAVTAECRKHEESKDWKFASSCEEAYALWSVPESMPN
jgi:two-component system cell cycle response regulator